MGDAPPVQAIAAPSTAHEYGEMFELVAGLLQEAMGKDERGEEPVNHLEVELTTGEALVQRLRVMVNPLLVLSMPAAQWSVGHQPSDEAKLRASMPVVRRLADSKLVSLAVRMMRSRHFDFARDKNRHEAASTGSRWGRAVAFELIIMCGYNFACAFQHLEPDLGCLLYEELLSGGMMHLIAHELNSLSASAGVPLPPGATAAAVEAVAALAAAPEVHRREIVKHQVNTCMVASRAMAMAVKDPKQGAAVLCALHDAGCLRAAVRAATALQAAGLFEDAANLMMNTGHILHLSVVQACRTTMGDLVLNDKASWSPSTRALFDEVDDPAVVTGLLAVIYGMLGRLGSPLSIDHPRFEVGAEAAPNLQFLLCKMEDAFDGLLKLVHSVSGATIAQSFARRDVMLLVLEALKVVGPTALQGWQGPRQIYELLPEADQRLILPHVLAALECSTANTLEALHGQGHDDSPAAPGAAWVNPFFARLRGSDATMGDAQEVAATAAEDAQLQPVPSAPAGCSGPMTRRGTDAPVEWLQFLQQALEFVEILAKKDAAWRWKGTAVVSNDESTVLTARRHTVFRCAEAILRGAPDLHSLHLWALLSLVPGARQSAGKPTHGVSYTPSKGELLLWGHLAQSPRQASVLLSAVKFVCVQAGRVVTSGRDFGASHVASAAMGNRIWGAASGNSGAGLAPAVQLEVLLVAVHTVCLLAHQLRDMETTYGPVPVPVEEACLLHTTAYDQLVSELPAALPAAEAASLYEAAAAVQGVRCGLSRQLLVASLPVLSAAHALARASPASYDLYERTVMAYAVAAAGLAADGLLDQASADAALSFMSGVFPAWHGGLDEKLGPANAVVLCCAMLCTFAGAHAQGLLSTSQVQPFMMRQLIAELRTLITGIHRSAPLTQPAAFCALKYRTLVAGDRPRAINMAELAENQYFPRRLIPGGEILNVGDYWLFVLTRAAEDLSGAEQRNAVPAAPAPGGGTGGGGGGAAEASGDAFSHLSVCANPACVNLGGTCELRMKLMRCSRCKGDADRYCGRPCQVAHNRVHKLRCWVAAPPPALVAAAGAPVGAAGPA